MYNPDRWTIVKITSPQFGEVIKVLAGWYGGYLGGDSWKLSSGMSTFTVEGDYYIFPQESGSVYKCHKEAEGLTSYTSSILETLVSQIEQVGGTLELIAGKVFTDTR